jgi:hypothetical protein
MRHPTIFRVNVELRVIVLFVQDNDHPLLVLGLVIILHQGVVVGVNRQHRLSAPCGRSDAPQAARHFLCTLKVRFPKRQPSPLGRFLPVTPPKAVTEFSG